MRVFDVDLKKEYGRQGGTLTCFLADAPMDGEMDWKRPALIIIPGGGYANTSKREGEPLAFEFLARGFHTFVLHYVTGKKNGVRYPEQLLQAASAVDYVKKNAEDFCVNPDEVFIMGFSAGGHLAANLCVEYGSVEEKAGRYLDCKPVAAALGYPVISKIDGHQGSYEQLLDGYSEDEQAELLKTLNLDQAVTADTVPAFIWSTVQDAAVPVSNALRYAAALNAHKVPFELHIYPEGKHGLSTGSKEINPSFAENPSWERVSVWMDECEKFFRLFIKEQF